MANTALNRTTQALLTNKSGGALVYGDVVVLDNTNANGFTTTTSAGLSTRGLGVILEPNGIANNASGMVALAGWCPIINLNTAATVGQFIKTHTVAGQGTPHSSPQVEGDFAVALDASATPPAMLFGSANGPAGGGGTPGGSNTQVQYNNASAFGGITGATTDGTTLTLVAPVLGTPASGTLTNCTGYPAPGMLQFIFTTVLSPADATTYHFGFRPSFVAGTSTEQSFPVIAPRTGSVVAVYGRVAITGTLGSAGNSTFTLVNITAVTSETISSTVTMSANPTDFNNAAMTLAFSAGDLLEISFLTPTWVTNPTGVLVTVFVQVKWG